MTDFERGIAEGFASGIKPPNKKIEYISRVLARHFRTGDEGPCACLGYVCGELGCVHFWELLLDDPDGLRAAISLYSTAQWHRRAL